MLLLEANEWATHRGFIAKVQSLQPLRAPPCDRTEIPTTNSRLTAAAHFTGAW